MTVLVGLAVKGVPQIALIGRPFVRKEESLQFEPLVFGARSGLPWLFTVGEEAQKL